MVRLRANNSRAFRVNSLSTTLLDFCVRAYLAVTPYRESGLMGDFTSCRHPPFSFSFRVDLRVASAGGLTLDICWDFE